MDFKLSFLITQKNSLKFQFKIAWAQDISEKFQKFELNNVKLKKKDFFLKRT